MTPKEAIAQLVLLSTAEEDFVKADLELQQAREKFVELGAIEMEAYSNACERYIMALMMVDTARHFKLNVDREALDAS